MNIGDIVKLKKGHPFEDRIGLIVERTFQILPPGTIQILVYKVLLNSIIINVPLKWMVQINTHPNTGEIK